MQRLALLASLRRLAFCVAVSRKKADLAVIFGSFDLAKEHAVGIFKHENDDDYEIELLFLSYVSIVHRGYKPRRSWVHYVR